jgi:GT2 family glycosyltransferase
MIEKSDVTIVIPHLSTELADKALKECLTSLRESGFPVENIIIAYNGVFGGFGEVDVPVVWVERQGQCGAVNAAIATVTTPWVMVSNNDMIYPPDWFERLTELGYMPDPFVISPQLIEPNDGAVTFKKYFCGGADGDFDKKKFMTYAQGYKGEGIRSGFNLPFLLKKEIWDLVGGYDVNYDPWSSNSDSDLEYKFKLAGIRMYQHTGCPVYHFSQTSGTFHPSKADYWSKNWNYFIEKWGFPRTDDGIWQATFEIPTVNMGRVFTPWWEGYYSKETS